MEKKIRMRCMREDYAALTGNSGVFPTDGGSDEKRFDINPVTVRLDKCNGVDRLDSQRAARQRAPV